MAGPSGVGANADQGDQMTAMPQAEPATRPISDTDARASIAVVLEGPAAGSAVLWAAGWASGSGQPLRLIELRAGDAVEGGRPSVRARRLVRALRAQDPALDVAVTPVLAGRLGAVLGRPAGLVVAGQADGDLSAEAEPWTPASPVVLVPEGCRAEPRGPLVAILERDHPSMDAVAFACAYAARLGRSVRVVFVGAGDGRQASRVVGELAVCYPSLLLDCVTLGNPTPASVLTAIGDASLVVMTNQSPAAAEHALERAVLCAGCPLALLAA